MGKKWLFQSKGRKILVLGVQTHNSSAYAEEEMRTAWNGLELMGANTMEVPIYWDRIEPEEGRFDFSMIDYLLKQARERGKYLILLWFASWKNGNMRYTPLWVKRDRERFHRALNSDGVAVASLSAHCEAGREADARAFHAVMEHIRQVDAEQETILAIQVENEPGYAARTPVDYGPDGQRALRQRVPKAVLDFIEGESEGSEYEAFVKNGCRRDGDWVETFGKRGYDLCTAYGVATWIDYVAMRGKQACDRIPMYVNVWLDHQLWDQPGLGYPAGGACTRNLVLWKSCTPHIDAICPDVYLQPMNLVTGIYRKYSRPDNPLFIPESGPVVSNALNMVRGFAEYGLQGISFFGVESYTTEDETALEERFREGTINFAFLKAIAPLIIRYSGTDRIHALYQEEFMHEYQLRLKGYECVVSFDSHPEADLKRTRNVWVGWYNKKWQKSMPRGRGILIEAEDGAIYAAGAGMRITMRLNHDEGVPYSPIVEERNVNWYMVHEGRVDPDGTFVTKRVRSGDESDYGVYLTPDSGCVKILFEEE